MNIDKATWRRPQLVCCMARGWRRQIWSK